MKGEIQLDFVDIIFNIQSGCELQFRVIGSPSFTCNLGNKGGGILGMFHTSWC